MKKLLIFLLLLTPLCSEAQFSIRNVGFLGALRGHRAAKLATPSGLSVTVGDGTAELSWTAVANADAYTFYISTNADFTGASFGGTATNSKHLSGLTNGVTYYWKVRASGAGFTASAYAVGASFTPVAGGAGPSLLFASIDDSLKNYIALHYSAALDNTSLPAAHDFALATGSTHFITGNLAKPYAIESPASTVLPIANTGGWGSSLSSYSFINISHRSRIRYSDTVIKLKFWAGPIDTGIHSVKAEFWRPNGASVGGNFHRISSQEILMLLTPNSINTITLPSYVVVKEDDRIGMSVTANHNTPGSLFATEAANHTGSNIYPTGMYWAGTVSTSDLIWSNALYSDTYVPIMAITKNAPLIMHIGDSNVEGYPTNTSDYNVDVVGASGITESFRTTVSFKLGVRLNCNVVNSGVSGQTEDTTRARFGQVIQSNVKYVIIGATTNGSGPGHDLVTDIVKMVDTSVNAGIVTFVNSVQPATTSDSWARAINHALDSAVNLHGGHFVWTWPQLVDSNTNLLLAKYQSDGIHINSAGMDVVAQIDADSISRYTPVEIRGNYVYVKANRNFSATDRESISYTVDGQPIRVSVGSNASSFSNDSVINNLTLAPEDIYFDVVSAFGETAAHEWAGTWGQSDKKMPNTGISWLGTMTGYTHTGTGSLYLLNENKNAIQNFDPNTSIGFSQIGWQGSGTGYIWPIQPDNSGIPGANQTTDYPDTFAYNSIYRQGADFYIAGSNDNVNWTKFFKYKFTSSKPMYIWVYGGAYHPAGYNLIPYDAADNIAPTVVSITSQQSHSVLLESDERLSISTSGFTLHDVTANSNLTITSIEEVPEHHNKFLYQFIVSQTMSSTDSFTLSYNSTTGATTDTAASHNPLASFTKGVINNIAITEQNVYAQYGAFYIQLDSAGSKSSGTYAKNGLYTSATGSSFGQVNSYYVPNGSSFSAIITPHSIYDVYVITIRKHGTAVTSTGDTTIGYGFQFANQQLFAISNDGAGNVTSSQIIGGGPYQNEFFFNRNNGTIKSNTPDGAGGWTNWGQVNIPAWLQTEDWDIVLTVVDGYLFYPVMARL